MDLPDRPINVLRVITWLPTGGIERRLVALLPRIDRERFNVSVACIRERGPLADELEAAGIRVDCVPLRSRWDPRGLKALASLMRERRIDIVHSHMYRSNVPATVAARWAGVRRVWGQVHNVGTWETRRQAWVDRRLCRWRTGMIAVSDRVGRDIIQTLCLPPERVRVIYNGVDIGKFATARARRAEIRRREGVGENEIVLIFMARLVPQKRPQDFLELFGRLQAGSGGDRLRAWVLGDGSRRADMERRAAGLPRSDRVTFFGQHQDVENYLSGADLFVMTSEKEGFSNALVEAMASGLAIVATDVGGNAEALRDGIDGLIIPSSHLSSLEESVNKLIYDSAMRSKLASSAAERARLFSLATMQEAIQNLYLESMRRIG